MSISDIFFLEKKKLDSMNKLLKKSPITKLQQLDLSGYYT